MSASEKEVREAAQRLGLVLRRARSNSRYRQERGKYMLVPAADEEKLARGGDWIGLSLEQAANAVARLTGEA
jgi:hypothetical protein